jgi:hypothetical protein
MTRIATGVLMLFMLLSLVPPTPLRADEYVTDTTSQRNVGKHGTFADREAFTGTMDADYDGENVELIGRWIAGSCVSIAVQGSIAYCGVPGGLIVVDSSSPESPVELARLPLPGICPPAYVGSEFFCNELAIEGETVYVANWSAGLRIIDVSAPYNPREVGTLDLTDPLLSVDVSGHHVYVTDFETGLRVIDVSDPADPREVGVYDTGGFAYDVATGGDYAYVARKFGGLLVIDISDPTTPVEVGLCDTPHDAQAVAVAGDFAYVANGRDGLRIIDVSNPTDPTETGGVDTRIEAIDVAVQDNYVYVADVGAFEVYDVSDPTAPWLAASLTASAFVDGVAVSGDRAFVANSQRGARVIDISDPSSPQLTGTHPTGHQTIRVAVSGDHAYVTQNRAGLEVLDISNPSSPSLVTTYGASGAGWGDIVADGHHIYAGQGTAFRALDVSDPANPMEVGSHTLLYSIRTFAVLNGYAYVANGFRGLQILRVDDPTAPTPVGRYEVFRRAIDVAVDGDYACVVTDSSGLRVLDISTPASPHEVGFFETGATDGGYVAMDRGYAYVTTGAGGSLHVLDLSSPEAPREMGRYDSAFWAGEVAVGGDYVYAYLGRLRVLDVSDPAEPTEAGSFLAGSEPLAITLNGEYAYSTDLFTGLYILKFNGGRASGAYLDIRPGSCPNPLPTHVGRGEKANGGVLRAAVLGSEEFDVRDIDVSSLALAGAAPLRHRYEDISGAPIAGDECACPEPDADGYNDLTLMFSRRDVVAGLGNNASGEVPVWLTGRMKDGNQIELADCVRLVPDKNDEGLRPQRADTPLETTLGRAMPNPFNPSTRIPYQLAKAGHATLKVYDVAGRLIATLVDGEMPAGRHAVTWEATTMASGVYFCRFQAGDYVQIRKLVMLK